jgi:putative transposase
VSCGPSGLPFAPGVSVITDRPKRLTGVSYVGLQRYFVTACTAFRKPIFKDDTVATQVISRILATGDRFGFAVVAYCAMPDHVHLLLIAQSEDADFTRFVRQAKQTTGFWYRQATNSSLWQPGYHERVLRDDEATLAVARYVLENPVRAGLAKELGKWPHAGSAVYSWPELFTAWEDETRTRERQT